MFSLQKLCLPSFRIIKRIYFRNHIFILLPPIRFLSSINVNPETKFTQTQIFNECKKDSVAFWRKAAQEIEWSRFPSTIFKPHDTDHQMGYSWFTDGELNLTTTALDKHIANGRGEQLALIHDSLVTDSKTHWTYNEFHEAVEKCAFVLKNDFNVNVGDRVLIYMPMIPESAIAMYASARIGAIHTVVFGGFAGPELAKRIIDCEPKIIITAVAGKEVNRIIDYRPLLENALQLTPENIRPKHVLIKQRPDLINIGSLVKGRDYDWDECVMNCSGRQEAIMVPSNHPLYILYTSGTTGTPKGIIRDTGGCAVTLRYMIEHFYNCNTGDVMMAGSDIGWVVGHSHIVYSQMLMGATSVMYEGKPVGTPDAGAIWRLISEYNIKSLFLAPTAVRAIRKEDPNAKLLENYDISSLKNLFLAGEKCDRPTMQWLQNILPDVYCSDHWWQTETGWPITGTMLGDSITHRLPNCIGSGGQPTPGMMLSVVPPIEDGEGEPQFMDTENIHEMADNEIGELALKLPLPPGTLGGIWRNPRRTFTAYCRRYPGYYVTGDIGTRDENGFIHVLSRNDDLINVAGHRIATSTIEEVLLAHEFIAECAVIGIQDALKGEVPIGIVIINAGFDNIAKEEIERQTVAVVREMIGAVVSYRRTIIVNKLPKTRSGKILRKSLREIYHTGKYNTVATIEDEDALEHVKIVFEEEKAK